MLISFRCPEVPHKEKWSVKSSHIGQVEEMERCIKDDIKDVRFIPYIQLHEFEALLFASNEGFNSFFDEIQKEKAQQIINSYDNPEDINTTPGKVHLPNGY